MMEESRKVRSILGMVLVASLMCAADLTAATKFKVFLLAGQSNSVGWNPGGSAQLPDSLRNPQPNVKVYGLCGGEALTRGNGCGTEYEATKGWTALAPQFWGGGCEVGSYISFGHNMAKLFPHDSIAIIICAAVSPITEDWRPPSQPGGAGITFNGFVKGVRRGIADLTALGAGNTGEIAGMMWVHGESDADEGNTQYGAQLTSFIHDMRDSMYLPYMPFVLSKINPYWEDSPSLALAQENVAKTVANCAFVETASFATAEGGHYTAAAQVLLGNRFTTEMMRILGATGTRENALTRGISSAGTNSRGFVIDGQSSIVIRDLQGRTIRRLSPRGTSAVDLRACGSGAVVVTLSDRNSLVSRLMVR